MYGNGIGIGFELWYGTLVYHVYGRVMGWMNHLFIDDIVLVYGIVSYLGSLNLLETVSNHP